MKDTKKIYKVEVYQKVKTFLIENDYINKPFFLNVSALCKQFNLNHITMKRYIQRIQQELKGEK